jgi:hypothetical protein
VLTAGHPLGVIPKKHPNVHNTVRAAQTNEMGTSINAPTRPGSARTARNAESHEAGGMPAIARSRPETPSSVDPDTRPAGQRTDLEG